MWQVIIRNHIMEMHIESSHYQAINHSVRGAGVVQRSEGTLDPEDFSGDLSAEDTGDEDDPATLPIGAEVSLDVAAKEIV